MQHQILITISPDELQKLLDKSALKAVQMFAKISRPHEKEIMNVKEVAVFLDLAESTIYRHTHMNTLPHYKKGKKLYFKRSEIEAWQDRGKQLTQDEFNALANLKLNS